MKYTYKELQNAYVELGSWNKVSKQLKIGLGTLSLLKKQGHISQDPIWSTDLAEAQKLYDSGMSITVLANHYGVSRNKIQRLGLISRNLKEAKALVPAKIWTDEEKKIYSDRAKANNLGGYNPHPNKGIWYQGVWFDSSYEHKVAVDLDSNNIKWERPRVGFSYGVRKYYPDFYLPDYDVYLDPKNDYLIKKDSERIKLAETMNNIRVLILTKDQLSWSDIQKMI